MVVLEGSERFVDVFGLARNKISQLCIVTAQALIATHKRNIIATFYQMAFLGKEKKSSPVCRWKPLARTAMTDLGHNLVGNRGYSWMVFRYHYNSKTVLLIFRVASHLKTNLVYCRMQL
jgi:hypothetical protein